MSVELSLLDLKFVGLLSVVALTRRFWPVRHFAFFGAVSSALLIGLASPQTLLAIAGLTLLVLYPSHRLLRIAQERKWSPWVSTSVLAAGLGIFAVLLIFFKIYRHFTLPWVDGRWLNKDLLALIGFSYFVLRAISLLHIQSILKTDERTPWNILWFALFPPTITSGPIQKFPDFRDQVSQPLPLTRELMSAAGYRITRGYFRKVFVAFLLNGTIEKMLAANQFTVFSSLAVIVLLYLYFYFDFAGYSDIAIGFGMLIGIKVPENFRKPFLATTVSEFWRNWHITLVDWFRDNIFIPLGGMQASRQRASALALLIMVLCGAWHGLTLPFILWGTWHGIVLGLEGLSGSKPVPPSRRAGLRYWVRVLWTNARVALPCIFFLPNWDTIARIARGLIRFNFA